jgi:hypothetical protein
MTKSRWIPHKLNEIVRIRLTPAGDWQYSRFFPDKVKKEDAKGWSKWTLWELMMVFGETLHAGGDVEIMFENNEIRMKNKSMTSRKSRTEKCTMAKSRWTSYNLNDRARVQLTPAGKAQYLRILSTDPRKGTAKEEDANDWSEWVLWELMMTFGEAIHVDASEAIFKNNEIQIEKEVDDLD